MIIISPRDPMVAPWSSSSGLLSGEGWTKHTTPWINVVQDHLEMLRTSLALSNESVGYGLSHTKPSQSWFSAQLLLAFLVDTFFSLSLVYFSLDLRYLDNSATFILSQVPIWCFKFSLLKSRRQDVLQWFQLP